MSNTNEAELDLLAAKSQFEKFVIYLPSKFFNTSIFKSIYQRIRKKLRYKGIMTYDIDEYAKNLIRHNNYCNSIKDNLLNIASEFEYQPDVSINYLLKNNFGNEFIGRKFDDLDYPSANVLYIHLFGGYYYNDKIYAKKKFELERELLFFIAGNLGVGKITYTITNKETVISKIKSDVNIQNFKNQVQFVKSHTEKNCRECVEVYENNGAPILFDASGDIKKLEKEIKKSLEPINSHIFNYEFYKSNHKMIAFVCKRFLFKMNTLDYTSESEDVSEMSLTVQSCFADYGLQIAFESSNTVTEKVTYKLEFHKESDLLETYFQKKKYTDSANDPFVMIRKFYDEDKSTNKIDSKNMINKYIRTLAEKCEYKIINSRARHSNQHQYQNQNNTYTFSKKLDDFIRKSESKLSARYNTFYTTRDIKKWFDEYLLIRNREEVSNDFLDDYKNKIGLDIKVQKTYEEKIIALEARLKETLDILEQLKNKQSRNILYSDSIAKEKQNLEEHKIHNENRSEDIVRINPVPLELQELSTSNKYTSNYELENVENDNNKESQIVKDIPIEIEYSKTLEVLDMNHMMMIRELGSYQAQPTYKLEVVSTIQKQSVPREPSPSPSLTLSENSLSSVNAQQPEKPILLLEYPISSSISHSYEELKMEVESVPKTTEELIQANEHKINRYIELNKLIDITKSEIKNKSELLEKYKFANKDRLTEKLIELSSTQNSLQSLRSRRVMEQIKQSSCGVIVDNENKYDTIDKIIGMFSRKNAQINNLEKQIDKTMEKCKALEDEITSIKLELKNKEDEIEKLTSKCDEYSEEQSQLETHLLDCGFVIEQLYNLLTQCKDIDNTSYFSNSTTVNDTTKHSPKNPHKVHKKQNILARTFSNRSQNHIVVSSV